MRRVLGVAVLAMALPIAAWADGLNLVNRNGTIKLADTGILSTNSHLIQFQGIVATLGHALGVVNYGTGALTSGSIFGVGGATFSDVGSFFNVTGTGGVAGVPKGPIFTGAFVGPILWTQLSQTGNGCPTAPCMYQFQLSGNLRGQLFTGRTVNGDTTQNITVFFGEWLREGDGHMHTGNTHFVTPEPGTLALLGTGLVGVATLVRRKLVS